LVGVPNHNRLMGRCGARLKAPTFSLLARRKPRRMLLFQREVMALIDARTQKNGIPSYGFPFAGHALLTLKYGRVGDRPRRFFLFSPFQPETALEAQEGPLDKVVRQRRCGDRHGGRECELYKFRVRRRKSLGWVNDEFLIQVDGIRNPAAVGDRSPV